MPPSKSCYWKFFARTNEGGRCILCHQIVKTKGNTTNLRFYLARAHPKVLLQIKNTTDAETSGVTESSISTKQGKVMSQDETSIDLDIDVDDFELMAKSVSPSTSPSSSVTSNLSRSESSVSLPVAKKRQCTLDVTFRNQKSFYDGGTKAAEFTNYLVFMIAKDNMPFATVEKKGFRTFMKMVSPLYKIPSRKKITNLVEEKYEFLSESLEALNNVRGVAKFRK
ncbi:uncharacterized protein LOC105840848 [Monomorium pharaonis]|uniref:uncharacterized protein LOC105840848 n=1 Tax=Monomorium pharaonis TaxID=307658 RepID=UPI00063F5FBF|nr:uncharacterized protein LOC105840848 [Monomorium pharaonis]